MNLWIPLIMAVDAFLVFQLGIGTLSRRQTQQSRNNPAILEILQTLQQILRLLHRQIIILHLRQRNFRPLILALTILRRSPEILDIPPRANRDSKHSRRDTSHEP
jgi:hypothetical protein